MTEPLDAYYVKERRRIEERRKLVALPANLNKSNRALAKELDVSEGTVRGDRKWLALPLDQRPVPKPKLPAKPKTKRKKPYDPSNAERHRKLMLAAAKEWISQVGVVLADIEWLVDESSKQLFFNRLKFTTWPRLCGSPRFQLALLMPTDEFEDYMPYKLYFLRNWLTVWLACCLPGQEGAQEEMLRQILRLAKIREAPWGDFPPL